MNPMAVRQMAEMSIKEAGAGTWILPIISPLWTNTPDFFFFIIYIPPETLKFISETGIRWLRM